MQISSLETFINDCEVNPETLKFEKKREDLKFLLLKDQLLETDFLALIDHYNDYLSKELKQLIKNKFYEQIDIQTNSSDILLIVKLCQDLEIDRFLVLNYNGKKLELPYYFKRILELDFIFFEKAIFGYENVNVWKKDSYDNINIYLEKPEGIDPEFFLQTIHNYLKWLYEDFDEINSEFLILQEYFVSRPSVLDISDFFIESIERSEFTVNQLIDLATNIFLPTTFKVKIASYLLEIAIDNQINNKNNKEVYQIIINFYNSLDPQVAIDLCKFPFYVLDLEFLTPFFLKIDTLYGLHAYDFNQIISLIKICPNIQAIDFQSCLINDVQIEEIAKLCPKLTHINLSNCNFITDNGLISIAQNCNRLTHINLNYNLQLTDFSITAIADNCNELTFIELSQCKFINDQSLMLLLECCPNITHLNLSSTSITNLFVNKLAQNCPNLTHLNLNNCINISNKALIKLTEKCPNLTHLNLKHLIKIKDSFIEKLVANCLNLQHINLSGCYRIRNTTLHKLVEQYPNLINLNLSICDVDDVCIKKLVNHFHLKNLNLSFCNKITDQSIEILLSLSLDLYSINLHSCDNISDSSIIKLSCSYPNLLKINLSGTKITDTSIEEIARNCPLIQKIFLAFCKITDKSILKLAEQCQELTHININGCENVTDHAIQILNQKLYKYNVQ